jgi:NAD(P)-dependent dehydrogenase (short-subunit alcohol dehydrogenase family)
LATVKLFDSLGALVVIADRNAPPKEKVGAEVLYIETDVTSWSSLLEMFAEVYKCHGRIDILFANAGQHILYVIHHQSKYDDYDGHPNRKSLTCQTLRCGTI